MNSSLIHLYRQCLDYSSSPGNSSLYRGIKIEGDLLILFIKNLEISESNSSHLDSIARQLSTTSDQLRQSGLKFIKDILLSSQRNYYDLLGVSSDADTPAIKRQYHRLISILHPDRKKDELDISNEYAHMINRAYSTLKRKSSRLDYDRKIEDERLQSVIYSEELIRPTATAPAENKDRSTRHAVIQKGGFILFILALATVLTYFLWITALSDESGFSQHTHDKLEYERRQIQQSYLGSSAPVTADDLEYVNESLNSPVLRDLYKENIIKRAESSRPASTTVSTIPK